jgi:hypothetical protein
MKAPIEVTIARRYTRMAFGLALCAMSLEELAMMKARLIELRSM